MQDSTTIYMPPLASTPPRSLLEEHAELLSSWRHLALAGACLGAFLGLSDLPRGTCGRERVCVAAAGAMWGALQGPITVPAAALVALYDIVRPLAR